MWLTVARKPWPLPIAAECSLRAGTTDRIWMRELTGIKCALALPALTDTWSMVKEGAASYPVWHLLGTAPPSVKRLQGKPACVPTPSMRAERMHHRLVWALQSPS